MLPYDGVIRKRLRIKGHPEIPPFSADIPVHEPVVENEQASDHAPRDRISPDQSPLAQPPAVLPTTRAHADNRPPYEDTRTDAERRRDEVIQGREGERLKDVAGKSYREQVEEFNKRLTEEPEHYDLFKTSFTK